MAKSVFQKYSFPIKATIAAGAACGVYNLTQPMLGADIDTDRTEYSEQAIKNFERDFESLADLKEEIMNLSGAAEIEYGEVGDSREYRRINSEIERKAEIFENREKSFVARAYTNIHIPEDVLMDFSRMAQDMDVGNDAHWGHWTQTKEKIYVEFNPAFADQVQECRTDFARGDGPIQQSLTNAREIEQCAMQRNAQSNVLSGMFSFAGFVLSLIALYNTGGGRYLTERLPEDLTRRAKRKIKPPQN